MPIYKGTFSGGTIGQAMAKHKFQEKAGKESGKNHGGDNNQHSNLGGHLKKAAEHIQHATEMHTKGTLSETQQADPRHVDEEEEAPTMGEPGGEGMRGTGY